MFGYSEQEWRQYVADLRASYTETFTAEEQRDWDEPGSLLGGKGLAALHARVEWFRERRQRREHGE